MNDLFNFIFEEIPAMSNEECNEYDNEIWKDMGNGISVSNYENYYKRIKY